MSIGADFRKAVETQDLDAMRACLAPDVEFHSPVAFKPYHSRETVSALLGHVSQTFEEFVYIDEIEQGTSHMLRFTAKVNGRRVEGVDLLDIDSDGLVGKFTVMVRPLSAAIALAEAMGARIQEAGGLPGLD